MTGKIMTSGNKPNSASWLAVLSLSVTSFIMVTTELLPIGLLTDITASLGVSIGSGGLMVTIPGVVAAIAAPVLGLISGRLDRRLLMLSLSVLLIISNLLSALAVNYSMMILSRFLLGICVGGYWSFSTNYGRHLVPEQSQGRALAIIISGVSVGVICGVPAGALLGDLFGWRSAFFISTALTTLIFLAQLRLLKPVPATRAITVADLLSPFRLPLARIGLIAIVLLFMGHFAAYTYLRPLLQQIFALSPSTISFQFLIYGAIGLLGTFAAGRLAQRNLRATCMLVALMLASILTLAPSLSGLTGATLMVLVWGLAFGAVPISATHWMFAAVPDAPEAGQALLVCVVQIALASGAWLGGEVVDWKGVTSAISLGGVLTLCAAVVFGLSFKVRAVSAKSCP